jgi:hypothetical protein
VIWLDQAAGFLLPYPPLRTPFFFLSCAQMKKLPLAKWMKWLGTLAGLGLIVAGFQPWVHVVSRDLWLSGVDTTGASFGRPAYFQFVLLPFFLLFTWVPRIWAKRANLMLCAINLAWAVRNYFMYSTCRAGECPEKQWALYAMLLLSVIMMLSALMPDMKPVENDNS